MRAKVGNLSLSSGGSGSAAQTASAHGPAISLKNRAHKAVLSAYPND